MGDDHPVYYVEWYDCVRFCNELSERKGLTNVYNESTWEANMNANGYRLPTEAEWEYACRAGTMTRFYWGDSDAENIMKQYCWYEKNAQRSQWTNPHADGEGTQPVGLKIPNDFGLYDMSGNVWEWCTDYYDDEYYSRTPESDPANQSNQFGSYRVVRGGCWGNTPWDVRSAYRNGHTPDDAWLHLGFRVVVGGVASRTK